jgi:cobalt-zinc-cadmium efflux system outer membrane protein
LEAVLNRARSASPDVVLAAHRLAEAEAARVGQGVPLSNPRLYADYRYLAREQPGTPSDPFHGYNFLLDGQFEVSGANLARLDEARRRVELAQAELDEERTRAAARAWLAYVELQVSELLVTSAEDAVALQERVLAASQQRLSVGVAGEPDLTQVAVELASTRVALEDARRQREAARLALAEVLDLPPSEAITVPANSASPGPVADLDAALARALERRPELKAQRARLALLEATFGRLSREAVPRLGVNLGFDGAPASPVFGFVGLSMELPVAQRNQGPRAVALAQLETERARLDLLTRRVTREVYHAHAQFAARLAALSLLTKDALPNAERTQALVEAGWRAGRFDVFRFTTATRDLLRVRREWHETLLSAWRDRIEFERVSGGLAP